jgi:hypothetical protein
VITLPSTVREQRVALSVVREHAIPSLTFARALGLFYACGVCGTIGGIAPGSPEDDRVRTRDALDLSCCLPGESGVVRF